MENLTSSHPSPYRVNRQIHGPGWMCVQRREGSMRISQFDLLPQHYAPCFAAPIKQEQSTMLDSSDAVLIGAVITGVATIIAACISSR